MGANSKIEWTTHTFNPWRGCQKVSPGCANCYAAAFSRRNPAVLGEWGPGGKRPIASDNYWAQPIRWNRQAAESGGPRPKVFCMSLGDVFEDRDELIEPRRRLFQLIDTTPHLDWLLLTKRPEDIRRLMPVYMPHYIAEAGTMNQEEVRENVWIGTSVENQEMADARTPELLKVPAAMRFLSCEPLLGPVDLTCIRTRLGGVSDNPLEGVAYGHDGPYSGCEQIHWVIAGGESGPGARPAHPNWFRSLRDQCQKAGVPFFLKQWGEWAPRSHGFEDAGKLRWGTIREDGTWFPETTPWNGHDDDGHGEAVMVRVNKLAAGCRLDGQKHLRVPISPAPSLPPIAH